MTSRWLIGLLIFAPLTAAADYQQCVVGALKQDRQASLCNFDDLQTQLTTANRGCQNEFIKLVEADPSVDSMRKVTAQIPEIKANSDQACTDLLAAEINRCGFTGTVKVTKAGMGLELIIYRKN